ncbi:glycoside hydrolase superfamily, partial [Mycena belliarum]
PVLCFPSSFANSRCGCGPSHGSKGTAPSWLVAYPELCPSMGGCVPGGKEQGFTLEEKADVGTGVGWMNGRCVGNTPPIGENGTKWPGLCLEDSPLDVRFGDYVTAFPTGVNTAATFNRKLIRRRGLFMGREFVGKGVNVALGPMMNIGRIAQGGRNWEGFGAEPISCRRGRRAGAFPDTESSDVDDRTQHEIYAHPFLRSIMAGVTSYSAKIDAHLINGTYACENDKIMNDIIKREFGFQGYIMSDWQGMLVRFQYGFSWTV